MNNFTFKITEVVTEKNMNGITSIKAICIQDNMILSTKVWNSEADNTNLIRRDLEQQHDKLLQSNKVVSIKVGDIL